MGAVSITKCGPNTTANNKLSPTQLAKMNQIRKATIIYNYCTDFKRFSGKFPKECSLPGTVLNAQL